MKEVVLHNRLEVLARQIARLSKILKDQQSFKSRFIGGLAAGLGTAIGASFIATLVIFGLRWLLRHLGVHLPDTS